MPVDSSSTTKPSVVPHIPKLSFQELSRCGYCEKSQSELPEAKLKRCTGCAVTYYCSKECQKASWPRHKILCANSHKETTGVEIGPEQLGGYPALASLENAVLDWCEAHALAFTNIASTTAHIHGGVDYNLRTSKAIVIRIRLRPLNAPGERTPANAFSFIDVSIEPMASFGNYVQGWGEMRKDCERVMENIHRDRPDRTYAGVLPAAFIAPEAGFAAFRGLAVYRRRKDDSKPIKPQERALMEDIRETCMRTVDAGLVMRVSSKPGRLDPDIGPLVLRKKKWEWKKMVKWDWDMIGMGRPGTTKTGLHPVQFWVHYFDL